VGPNELTVVPFVTPVVTVVIPGAMAALPF
jgi:hypothetical protein